MTLGPATKTNTARSSASTMLMFDSHWMPLSTPETADATNATVRTAMMPTSSPVATLSSQSSSSKPLPICNAPRPNEAAEPKRVAKMAMMSMTRPHAPWARFSPMSGTNTELTVCRRRRRNVL